MNDDFITITENIQRIKDNIANTYTELSSKGATLPETQNSDNLASCVDTIPVGSSLNLRILNLGCDIDSNGIASNFHGYDNDSTSVFGGFTYDRGGFFLDSKIVHQHQTVLQIKFKTPSTTQQVFICNGSSGAQDSVVISINSTFTTININTYNYNGKSASYNFLTDTWYIIQYRQFWDNSASAWKVTTSISTDDGATFTDIKTENGRMDTDQHGMTYYMYNTQFGYYKGYSTVPEIDLTKTGFIDITDNFTYMFAEV